MAIVLMKSINDINKNNKNKDNDDGGDILSDALCAL